MNIYYIITIYIHNNIQVLCNIYKIIYYIIMCVCVCVCMCWASLVAQW